MDKVLLIVPDWNLRQLYHELLFSKNIEVVPTENIGSGMMYLTADRFTAIVWYLEEDTRDVSMFLHVRRNRPSWSAVKIILLTSDDKEYRMKLLGGDIVLDPQELTPQGIAERVKVAL